MAFKKEREMRLHRILSMFVIVVCIKSLITEGYSPFPILIIVIQIPSIYISFLTAHWSRVTGKGRKPLMWWYYKCTCETWYYLSQKGWAKALEKYYKHLNIMCQRYERNLYGEYYPRNQQKPIP